MSQPFAPDPRAARLEARLALYAQYAALVSDEVAAAWSGEPELAGALTRELAAERQAIAARYEATRDAGGIDAATPEAFGGLLAGAMTELDHQAEVNRALRDRLVSLHASGWTAPGDMVGLRALPPASSEPVQVSEPAIHQDDPSSDAMSLFPELGGALVTARSNGVGGLLGGRYPGVVAGADSADYAVSEKATDVGAPVRVDLRF